MEIGINTLKKKVGVLPWSPDSKNVAAETVNHRSPLKRKIMHRVILAAQTNRHGSQL